MSAEKKAVKKKASAKKAAVKGQGNPKGKTLVIVESPSKAKTINKYLGADFYVDASMGHVRDLPKSKMGISLEKGLELEYVVPAKSRKVVNNLKKVAAKSRAVYLAPDPDREGEAISWHLAALLSGENPEIKRVVFNEITKEAVLAAFRNPRDINQNLVDAQQARRAVDRIVGYNLSPLLWKNVARGLSAGRVQSVALRLIVEREKEIKGFLPEEYWTVEALLSSRRPEEAAHKFIARLEKIKNEKAVIGKQADAQKIKEELEKQEFAVSDVAEKERRRKPTAPFTTSKLQQESYTKLGFTAAKTMSIAQQLYEGIDLGPEQGTVGLITYMRTDSVRISDQAVEEVRKYIGETYGPEYLPETPNRYKAKSRAQEAHEAIRATAVSRTPKSVESFLTPEQLKLYRLIWSKYVASQMKEALDRVVTAVISAGSDYTFKSSGTRNVFPGFLAVYDYGKEQKAKEEAEKKENAEEEDESGELPKLIKNEVLQRHEIKADQHFTKPLPRYNDASLVKELEEKGIGRPSTYAPTIHTLLDRHYVERKGGALIPTETGETVIFLLLKHFSRIMDYDFTANMENDLDRIEEGDIGWVKSVEDFYKSFESEMKEASSTMQSMKQEPQKTDYICDICGKFLVMRAGRFGKFLACSGFPECRYTRSVPTGFVCPNEGCGGEVVQRRSRQGKMFYGCSKYPACNFITNKLPASKEEPLKPSNTNNGEESKDKPGENV